jgi:hypothetical protein
MKKAHVNLCFYIMLVSKEGGGGGGAFGGVFLGLVCDMYI